MDVMFLENFNNKSGGKQTHKKRPTFHSHFTGSKEKNRIGLTFSIKFTLALHLYPKHCVCLSM